MNKEDREKLREIFFDMLLDVLDDYDPAGMIANQIKADSGISYKNYVKNRTEEFIGRLKDERLI